MCCLRPALKNFAEQVAAVLCLLYPPYPDRASEDILKSRDCKIGFNNINLSIRLGARCKKGL